MGLEAVARSRQSVALSPETRARVRLSRQVVDEAVARHEVVYGVNTGFGNFADVVIPSARLGELQLNLVRSHSAGVGEPGSIRFVTDDVEALVALGELEHARSILGRHEERARRLRRRSALAACARCRGLLAGAEGDFDGALASFGTALESYSVLSPPLERARTLLALGSVQRRAKQRAAARHSLDQALTTFDRLGARLWTERTRGELARIGGRAPSPDELSATEQRVAALVAAGRTNPEVAAELFLTMHTVEKALTRIYSKLGVRSRTELARKLAVKQ